MSSLGELAWQQLESFGLALLGTIATFFALCGLQIIRSPRGTPRAAPPPEFAVDLVYWHAVTVFRALARLATLGLAVLAAVTLGRSVSPALFEGFGPAARQPRWLMMVELFVLSDFISYWSHRAFHRVPLLWRFHAVHHSPRKVYWTSAARLHPVNEIITHGANVLPALALGFPLETLAPLVPIVGLYAVWSHSKSEVTMGPLQRVLTGPVFHRWHHTCSHEGGDRNFAGIFAFWDVLFGTHYMPAGKLPERFGLDDEVMDERFWAQMAYPFRSRKRREPAVSEPAQGGVLSRARTR